MGVRKQICLSVDSELHHKVREKVKNLSKTTENLWKKYLLGGEE